MSKKKELTMIIEELMAKYSKFEKNHKNRKEKKK